MANAQVATRMSCFALISGVEADLRRSISELSQTIPEVELLPSDVRERAARRRQEDRKAGPGEDPDSDQDLLDYTDFADLAKALNRLRDDFKKLLNQDVAGIASQLEQLAPIRNRVCH